MWTRSDGGGQNILDVIHEWSLVVAAAHGGAVGGLALGDRCRGGGRGRAAVGGMRWTALLAAPEMCKSLCIAFAQKRIKLAVPLTCWRFPWSFLCPR